MNQNHELSGNREREIFLQALEKSTAMERAAFLEGACGSDDTLRAAVEALLGNASDPLLDEVAEAARPALSIPVTERPGDHIGRYKLLQRIGEGGMGVVYMAEQEEPVRRKVALKIIKLGMDTRQVVARFEAERQALALMDHPNIAKVFDGGNTGQRSEVRDQKSEVGAALGLTSDSCPLTSGSGRPYFVMELVQGVPITEFCDKNQFTTEERLKLFMPVCQAIQSAHQKGIIHRDLKPSNVLVTLHDGVPVPKVIDFGVAKAINQKLTEKTLFTNFATMIGTPAYMSPEQAEMSGLDIDTRSDIYSLGVLLYELLTGTTPFPEQRLRSVAYREMQRIILEEEPERPSTRLRKTALAQTAAPLAPRRSSLATDLDWIVMKCLEKDRNRRYGTANGLTADLKRHLDNEPVVARPPSAAYRFRKMVRRHRAASTALALVTLAVLLGVVVSTWALVRERAARGREREARLREQAALQQASLRLNAALGFVDQVVTNVAPEIRLVAGAAEAQKALLQAGLNFVQRLRENAGDDPAARVALARLLLYMSGSQNPGEPNTTGDYELGLKRAEEALELLSAETPQLGEAERLELLYQGKLAIVSCLYGLGRWDEGVARSKEMDPQLDQLERFPDRAPWARKERMLVLQNAGWANFVAGRTNEALECVLSLLNSDWARTITNQLDGADWTEIHLVMNAHDVAGNVYGLLLKRFDSMRPHADESVRIGELLVQRFPGNAHVVYLTAQNRAWQGYALMRTGDTNDGLAALSKARQEVELRAEKEASSDAFRRNRMIITALQALAFAGWSEDASASLVERRQRLAQAEAYLAQAEEFSQGVKSHTRSLPTARAEVPAARAKLEADERAQTKR